MILISNTFEMILPNTGGSALVTPKRFDSFVNFQFCEFRTYK